ncbi:hypothetical protein NB689_000161 [Xanthomonas sacchari]|nr:hypothetical protein [Xanthomonas sacchari]MCW0414407.1 hypothetical protein [Xanthomonas sacchari]
MCGILPRALAVPVVGGTSVPTGEYLRGAFVRRSRGVRLLDPRWPFPVPCLPGCDVDIAPVPVASKTDAASRVVSVPRSAPAGRATHPPDLPGMHVRPGQPREYREARAVIVGVNLRDSYAGNDTTVGGSKGRHIACNDRPWPGSTDRRDRGRHSGRNAWHSPTQPRRCVRTCSASARLARLHSASRVFPAYPWTEGSLRPPAFATLTPDAVCPVGVDCGAAATSEAESRTTPSVVGTEVPPAVHPVGSSQAPVGADSATTGFVWNARRC